MARTTPGRTDVVRLPELQRRDRSSLNDVLDNGTVAHVAVVHQGLPVAVPMAYVRDRDRLLLHGSTASRLMRSLRDGAPTCVTVTLFDGLVIARSAFESSMHYRSAMIFGTCAPVADAREALERLTDGLIPGRWAEVRPATSKEVAATSILEIALDEWSVKIGDGDPEDPPADVRSDTWAGVLPMVSRYGTPTAAPDLRDGIAVPASVRQLVAGRFGGVRDDDTPADG